jgi:hypothetical protein
MRYYRLLSEEIVNWMDFSIKSLELSSCSKIKKDKLNFSEIIAIKCPNQSLHAYTVVPVSDHHSDHTVP